MCGIAGWIDYENYLDNKDKILNDMSSTLARRGPDAKGTYQNGEVCLLHRRLIVVDPDNGKQPMQKTIGQNNYIITYNGELYNTEEIRKDLIKKGYLFNGYCDTEVLLTAYIEWGEQCVQHLNGIYAFAVWNENEKELFAARDRAGVKPFFYYKYNSGLIFGSEIKTLLANPLVKHEIDNDGLNQIFLLGPARMFGNGVFKNVYELLPGEYLTFCKGELKIKTYWSLKAQEHTDNLQQTIEKTRFLIKDTIKRQLVSDVPLCCLLSGGLDSSIISKIASDEYKDTGKAPLTTYSVNYDDNSRYFQKSLFQPDADDRYIGVMSDFIGSDHHNIVLSNSDVADALYNATTARDLPGMADIDSSLLLFCTEIKKDFTVAVSGECADEIFGGYPWYHNEKILFEETFPWSRSTALRKSILKDGILQKDCDEFVRHCYLKTLERADKLPEDSKTEGRMREMFILNFYWFMQVLLDRKDRMSMYNGLEVRVPFCDHRLMEYAYNMPWEMKSLYGREKGIIREAVKDLLPDEIVWRKKSPYPKTHNPIYFGAVKEKVFKILEDHNSILYHMIDKQTLQTLVENPDSLVEPWYGQLMKIPQICAYLIQVNDWFQMYNIQII